MKKPSIITLFFLAGLAFCLNLPNYQVILNSYGFAGVIAFEDTLAVDTTGAGAYKQVTADTSKAIQVDYAERISYSWQTSGEDTSSYTEAIWCYDKGAAIWAEPGYYGGEAADSILVVDGLKGIKLLTFSACDSIKIVTTISATAGQGDTINILKRYLRLQE